MKDIHSDPCEQTSGFSRIDMIVVTLCLLLAVSVAVPVWAAAQGRGALASCKNNLRLIGQAMQGWAKDHDRRVPWRVNLADGGTRDTPAVGNAWVNMVWLSNYLASPKFLACPADKIRPAQDWSRRPNGGMLHQKYRGHALSYFLGLDVQESAPQAFLAGDANLKTSLHAQTCDYANVNNASGLQPGDKEVAWTDAYHGEPGNILRYGGSVDTLSTEQLRKALPDTGAVHEENHYLPPR